jgi:hypothetical protein
LCSQCGADVNKLDAIARRSKFDQAVRVAGFRSENYSRLVDNFEAALSEGRDLVGVEVVDDCGSERSVCPFRFGYYGYSPSLGADGVDLLRGPFFPLSELIGRVAPPVAPLRCQLGPTHPQPSQQPGFEYRSNVVGQGRADLGIEQLLGGKTGFEIPLEGKNKPEPESEKSSSSCHRPDLEAGAAPKGSFLDTSFRSTRVAKPSMCMSM